MAEIVLTPGFWLGGWAWDQVAERLRSAGHRVTAMTLPGLESVAADRSRVGLAEQVAAVVAVLRDAPEPVVLVGHSGAGTVIYGATDAMPEKVAAMVYVDSGPLADGTALAADLPPDLVEIPLPSWEDLEEQGTSLTDLDDATRAEFARRAVPHPAGPARDPARLANPARRDVPAVLVCSTYPSDQIRRLAVEGVPLFAELTHLRVSYVDLPTGHYPMWSRPDELAAEIDRVAAGSGKAAAGR